MNPSNTGYLMHRASCNYDQKNYQKSITDLLLGLDKTPTDPKILYQLGLSYYADSQYKQCIKTLKAALLNKPVSSYESDLYYHIGLSYCNIEKYEKAIYPLTKCLELVPSNVKYIHERAKAYQMIEEHENAVLDFNELINVNPKNAHAYFRRAFSLKALG